MQQEIIAVLGSGVMGGGIAQLFAEQGFTVIAWDVDTATVTSGVAAISKRLDGSVAKGKLTVDAAAAIRQRITPTATLSDLAQATMVIEAVIEDETSKRRLYGELERHIAPQAVIGSNTSSLSIAELAQGLKHRERFLGVHFFNPPTRLELVEVVSTPQLAPAALALTLDLLTRCGKSPVLVRDAPGFIVNRLLLPLINEAARLVGDGVAEPSEIDKAMRLGALHPAGPLQVADLIGLDVCCLILQRLSQALGNPHYAPVAALTERVAAGKLGRKSGAGFYTY